MSTAWIRAAGNWAVCLCCAAASWADGLTAGQSQPSEPVKEIVLRDWLVIEPVGRYGRSAVHTDAIEAEIVAGRWSPPRAGDTVTLPALSVAVLECR